MEGAAFYNIHVQLAYLSLTVGTTIIYTLLVTGRILALYLFTITDTRTPTIVSMQYTDSNG
jgi:hypothetical protein